MNDQAEQSSEKKSPRKAVLALLVAALLVGGLVFALRAVFRPSPEMILANMISRMSDLESYGFKWDGELAIQDEGRESKLQYGLEGGVDIAGERNSTVFKLDLLSEGVRFSLSGEGRQVEEIFYLKFDVIPSIFFFDGSILKEKWIKIDRSEVERDLEMKKKWERVMEEVIRLAIEENLLKVEEEFPRARLNGVDVYHFLVRVDKEKTKEIMPQVTAILKDSFEEEFEGVTEIDYGDLDEFFDRIGEMEAEFYIGKKDGYLYKIVYETNVDLSDLKEGSAVLLKAIINFFDFNKEMSIEAPEEYTTFRELIGIDLFSGF